MISWKCNFFDIIFFLGGSFSLIIQMNVVFEDIPFFHSLKLCS